MGGKQGVEKDDAVSEHMNQPNQADQADQADQPNQPNQADQADQADQAQEQAGNRDQAGQPKKLETALRTWLNEWPAVRREIEQMIAEHADRDPSLHFELALAKIELKDIDEAVQRTAALGNLLGGDELMTSAELKATGNY